MLGRVDSGDVEREVRSRKSADAFERFAQGEHRADVVAHYRCGGGGEGDALRVTDGFQRASEPQVIGPEIVTPLAEAVGLIDCEQRDFDALEGFEKTLGAEALGRDIDEFPIAVFHPVEPLALLWPAEGRVDHRGGNAARGEGIDLIFHQRDQRRDDDRDAAEAECGDLKAKRLASAGRHHD